MKAHLVLASLISTFVLPAMICASPLDTTQVFRFNSFYFTNGGVLTGSVTIDTTNGSVAGEDFTIAGETFTGIANVPVTSNPVYTSAFFSVPGGAQGVYLYLLLPVTSLIGYTGGFTCVEGYRANCVPAGQVNSNGTYFIDGSSVSYAYSGSLTPVQSTAVTPEPTSLALLVTGVLSATGILVRKVRN